MAAFDPKRTFHRAEPSTRCCAIHQGERSDLAEIGRFSGMPARDTITFAPPLIITHDEVEELFARCARALDAVQRAGVVA